jgi:hypothetical protein
MPHAPCSTYNTRSVHAAGTRSILPGLSLKPGFSSVNTPRALKRSCSDCRSQNKPSKRVNRKRRPLLEKDPLLHESLASKRVKREHEPSEQKQNEDDDTTCGDDEDVAVRVHNEEDATHVDDEEDAKLWSHFDDCDWDAIIADFPLP